MSPKVACFAPPELFLQVLLVRANFLWSCWLFPKNPIMLRKIRLTLCPCQPINIGTRSLITANKKIAIIKLDIQFFLNSFVKLL